MKKNNTNERADPENLYMIGFKALFLSARPTLSRFIGLQYLTLCTEYVEKYTFGKRVTWP